MWWFAYRWARNASTPRLLPMRRSLFALSLLFPLSAHAGGNWFLGGSDVEIAGEVEVPLLRGADDPRPQVLVETSGRVERAVLDVAGDITRIGWAQVRRGGLETEVVQGKSGWEVRTVLPELRISDVVIRDLRVQVVDTPRLVLGTAALKDVAVALLPSEGVVRISADGGELLEAVGDRQSAEVHAAKPQKVDGTVRWGNGVSLYTGGLAQVGAGDSAVGTWFIRTDWMQSTLSPVRADGASQRFGGVLHAWTRPQLGGVPLSSGWFRRDGRVGNTGVHPLGVLAYDTLWAVDLAVSPKHHQVAIRAISEPKWQDAPVVHLAAVRERWQAWRDENPVQDGADRPARPGFSDAENVSTWDPEALRQHRDLADALWTAGRGNASVAATRDASKVSGDRCDVYLELGLRRLRTAGAMQQKDFVASLVRQPLERAGVAWQKWADLTPEQRLDPDRDGDISEPPEVCQEAWGYAAMARVAQGAQPADLQAFVAEHEDLDARVPLAMALSMLRANEPAKSLAPLQRSLNLDGGSESYRAMMVATARSDRREQAALWLRRLSGSDPWPLSTAAIAGELGLLEHEDARAVDGWTARELMRGVGGKEVDLATLGRWIDRQLAASASAPEFVAQKVVWLRLSGEMEQAEKLRASLHRQAHLSADVWSSDLSHPDAAIRAAAQVELSMGWPELAQLGSPNSGDSETKRGDATQEPTGE